MKAQTASSRLDIRGITATEVALEVEKFLDDASLAGLGIVTIVHGKGTGVLAKEVAKVLKTHPLVESSRFGGIAEGGQGATIVYLHE
jgi:DNA mismatch repair protein MutS2